MKLAIVIPAHNEGKAIRKVINALPRKIKGIIKISVVVVNDGSTDNTATEINKTRALQAKHIVNMGMGAATVTGLEAAQIIGADIVVTLDGDGQHDPKDIPKMIRPIVEGYADMVIGSRLINSRGMPLIKKFGNYFFNIVTYLFAGHWTTDSQSGFKAISADLIKKFKLDTLGYETSSEIIIEAASAKARIKEVPIKVIYSHYSRLKGQSIYNGVNIIMKLILRKMRG